MKRIAHTLIALSAVWLLAACPGLAGRPASAPVAVGGTMDLHGWQPAGHEPLELIGQWEFYWGRLLSPGDFHGPVKPPRTGWFTMPGVWNGTTVDGRDLDGEGCATFRLHLQPDPRHGRLALLVPYAFTAYRVWVDDRPVISVGRVGQTADAMRPRYGTGIVFIDPPPGAEVVLTVQISNFMHAKGGMRAPIRLVPAALAPGLKHRSLAIDVLVFGCLVIMAIYHLALFAYRPADRFNLYFALCCLFFGLRASLTGEVFLLDIFPGIDWRAALRMEWLCVYVGAPLAIGFVHAFFPADSSQRLYRFSLAMGAALALFTVLASTRMVTGMFPVLTPLIGLMLGYTAWVLVVATVRGRSGARLMLVNLLLVIATVVNDILYANDLVQTGYAIPYGMLLFVFSQSIILSRRSAQAHRSLEAANAAYASEIVERERAQAEVKAYQGRLEELVRRRTDALAVANRKLQQELDDRESAEKEKSKLQAQLQRAQKMEALGTLAGGVAHDLNNILSGVVSYPDLLLEDLPPDSELRKPMQTIQQSGLKAAAIVQDLLTLARRGVAEFEVVDVNRIVKDYLASPEFDKLIQFHPSVRVAADLDPGLVPIKGATVHLLKTVMNLVSNAAEAMPDGGAVRISTRNRTVERPVDEAAGAGDYVRLRVVDEGIGISEADMARIFEPFYTKKVMGKSGTGLGMAVVWGTVKDHNGYIDMRSQEGAGTTFDIYFPASDEALKIPASRWTLADHRGNGERVLVVDDGRDQRDIAMAMLNRLGYRVASVGSGEAAVEHVSDRPVDLLLLDMIMDPGIDGLETYRRILALRPGQKALIASGYAETERVREAQRIGPAGYLKKPYRLETLAEAVKAALVG
jgi:signal transduction histidine kinase